MQFQYLISKPPFDKDEIRIDFLNRLNQISGVNIIEEKIDKRPSFKMELLENDDNLKIFFQANEWAIEQIKQYHNKNS